MEALHRAVRGDRGVPGADDRGLRRQLRRRRAPSWPRAATCASAGDNLKLAWAGRRHGVPVGPARLGPLIGISRAKELVFSGRVVGAEEALTIGFLHDAVPADEAEARALELAAGLGDVRVLKQLFCDLDGDEAARRARERALMEFQARGPGPAQRLTQPVDLGSPS